MTDEGNRKREESLRVFSQAATTYDRSRLKLTQPRSSPESNKMKQRKKRREQIGIVEGLAAEAIRCGADMIEVEYDEGYEEVYIRKGNIGLGTRFKGSEGNLLRKELYDLAKKKRRRVVDGVEYELRARVYDSFGEDAFQVQWRRV